MLKYVLVLGAIILSTPHSAFAKWCPSEEAIMEKVVTPNLRVGDTFQLDEYQYRVVAFTPGHEPIGELKFKAHGTSDICHYDVVNSQRIIVVRHLGKVREGEAVTNTNK